MTKKARVLKFPRANANPKRMTKAKRESLIIEYMPLVRFVARKFYHKTPPNVEMDDLVSSGVIGLMDAVKKFDLEKGVKFKTYAEHRIRGAILDELRSQDWVPRSVRNKEKIVEKSLNKIESTLGRGASIGELKTALNMDMKDVYKLLNAIRPTYLVALDEKTAISSYADKNGLSMRNMFSKNPQDRLTFASSCEILQNVMDHLTCNEKKILNLYYFESKNLKEISVNLGISESRVSQLHMRAKSKMKDLLIGNFECPEDLIA